jgi:uncharacterized membrane protein
VKIMSHVVIGLFTDSKTAGKAVAELKNKGYTKDISVIAKDPNDGKVQSHSIKQDGTEGAATGAGAGAVASGATVLIAGISAVAIPGIGLVAGAVATALAAAATGAVAGGIVGWLVDKGIPDNKATEYQNRINHGDVLVAVEVPHEQESDVQRIMDAYAVDAGTIEHQA